MLNFRGLAGALKVETSLGLVGHCLWQSKSPSRNLASAAFVVGVVLVVFTIADIGPIQFRLLVSAPESGRLCQIMSKNAKWCASKPIGFEASDRCLEEHGPVPQRIFRPPGGRRLTAVRRRQSRAK